MEHELSAYYDITHGLGLAILTPRRMEYTLDETTVSKFYQFGCNVFGIDKNNFSIMAKKACGGGVLPGFKPLNQQDIKNIFKMCL